jgi:hypothetical protein
MTWHHVRSLAERAMRLPRRLRPGREICAAWERLGNSVPPLMMKATAEVIRDKVLTVETQGSGRFS